VGLDDELFAAGFDFDETVQSYGIDEIEFHRISIRRKKADVRFPAKRTSP